MAAALRDDDTEWLLVDSSCVRSHPAAAGAKKADGTGRQSAQALSRGCGGFGTKIHAAVSPLGHPVAMPLTGAQAADSPHLPALIAGVGPAEEPERVEYDRHLYKERNGVERFFGQVKQYRRGATRYDKKATNFLGFVWLAAIDILLA